MERGSKVMNRRNFLQGIAVMFAAQAAERVIPFGRVWSFPKQIVIPKHSNILRIGDLLKTVYSSEDHLVDSARYALYGGARGGGKHLVRLAFQQRWLVWDHRRMHWRPVQLREFYGDV